MRVPIGTVCSKGENYLLSFCLFVLVVVVIVLFKKTKETKWGLAKPKLQKKRSSISRNFKMEFSTEGLTQNSSSGETDKSW